MNVLGITAPLSWNNAAAIVKNGKLLASAEEERFNRVKHSPRMPPYKSTEFCLKFAKVKPEEIDVVAVGYRSPFEAYALSIVENLKQGNVIRLVREGGAFAEYYVGWIRYKEWLTKIGVDFQKTKIIFVPHHIAHAASAFRCSGYSEANIITLDGQGEDDAGLLAYVTDPAARVSQTSFTVPANSGRDYYDATLVWDPSRASPVTSNIISLEKIGHHQSLGWVYTETTTLLGFKGHSHEGKVMGLAPYGKKEFDFSTYWETGTDYYKLNKGWLDTFWKKFGPARNKTEVITQKHKDIALTTQRFTEKVGVSLAHKMYERTGIQNFCLAGGVALNCDMNTKIRELPFVKNLFVQPASNDAGTAVGAALEVAHQWGEVTDFKMEHAYWGPEFTPQEIEKILKEAKVNFKKTADMERTVAHELSKGKIIGWFQGRSELGPRALGNRSILSHPGLRGMKDKINNQVKHREPWRPFAPSILHEDGEKYFENYVESPFMLLTFTVKQSFKSKIKEAIHVDNTARIHSVRKEINPRYYKLISEFKKITGIAAVLNTSFNDSEQPLVNSPKEAVQVFYSTGLDCLAIGDYLLSK